MIPVDLVVDCRCVYGEMLLFLVASRRAATILLRSFPLEYIYLTYLSSNFSNGETRIPAVIVAKSSKDVNENT